MKLRRVVQLGLSCLPLLAFGGVVQNPGLAPSGAITPGDCAHWVDATHVGDAGSPCGSGGTGGSPGGVNGSIQFNNLGSFGGFTASGDATINTSTGAVTVSKTGGVAFAPSATVDTTNAGNISSGVLPAGRLPVPSATSLGGVQSVVTTSHEWVDSISTLGVPHLSQPSAGDVSGLGSAATVNTGTSGALIPLLSTANTWTLAQTFSAAPVLASITGATQCLHVNASGIISGTGTDCGSASGGSGTVTSVGLSLPSIFTVTGSPVTTSGTLAGTLATQSANTIFAGPTSGVAAGPGFRALVGADLPLPSVSTLGGVESAAAVSHQWINSISTAGVPSLSQPAFGDISGTLALGSQVSGSLSLGNVAAIGNNTVLGNVSGVSAAPSALTATQLTTLCNTFTSTLSGCVPSSAGGTTNFLRADGAWAAPAGSGTVTGGSNEGTGVGVYDATNSTSTTLKFKTLVAGSNITLTDNGASGITIASSGGGGGSATIVQPQGRLTLTSGQPVMQSDVTGASTIYYTAQLGDQYPWYNGSAWAMQAFSSDLSVTLDSTNTASGSLYDIFGYVNSGTPVACYGPAWTNSTTRATAIARLAGIWVNSALMTCRASSSTTYTVPADEGTYLGTFYATAAGQTGVACKPAAAAGGANNVIGLWNAYNRVPVGCFDLQSTSYALATQTPTWVAAGGYATFRITFVDGLGESPAECIYSTSVATTAASRYPWIGCDQNSTSNAAGISASGASNSLASDEPFPPVKGLNYYQAMQSGTNVAGTTVTWAFAGIPEVLEVRTSW